MNTYTEDHLVERPAIQLMQHELGWDVVSCYDEWNGGVSNQGRDGKREGEEILNVGFWILNGRGKEQAGPWLIPKLNLAEANREIDKLRWLTRWILFVPEQRRRRKRLEINDILFDSKTSARVGNGMFQAGNPSGDFSQSRRNA